MSYECYMNVTFRFCFRSPLKSLKLPVFKGLSTDLGSHSFLHISFYPLYKKASIRGYIPVSKAGNYKATIRYQANTAATVFEVICGNATKQITLPKTNVGNKDWAEYEFDIDIADVKGNMTVNYVSGGSAVLDCVRLNYQGALTGIQGITTHDDVIDHVEYYDLQGMRLSAAKQGVNIKKVYLRSGKTYTEKLYK